MPATGEHTIVLPVGVIVTAGGVVMVKVCGVVNTVVLPHETAARYCMPLVGIMLCVRGVALLVAFTLHKLPHVVPPSIELWKLTTPE